MAGVLGLAGPALADEHMEAENAALKSQVEDLMREVQILKGMVLEQNEKIAAAAEPQMPAKLVKSGKKNVSLSISGQVNRMLLHANDGRKSRIFHADNDISATRVRFEGRAKLDDEWSAGANIEVQIESNSSAKVTIDQEENHNDGATFTERKLEVFFKNKNLGKLSFGQGSTASDGAIEEDLSGTGVITGAGFASLGGDIEFVKSDIGERMSTGVSADKVFDNQDGLSREDRLRYDSPSFGGFQLSTSLLGERKGASNDWDVALRYGREFDGFEVAAAAAQWKEKGDTGRGGSASILAPFGTSLSLSHSSVDDGSKKPRFQYMKLGQTFDITSHGKTAASVGYAQTKDQAGKGNKGSYYDLALVQKVKGLGAELYAIYGVYSADIVDAPTEDITVTGLGARIKF